MSFTFSKLCLLMIITSFIGVLPQPVFTDGVNYVEVKISEAAFFNLHFHSLLPDFTLCEWRKDHHKLTVSKKYQFSPLSQIDPTNVDTVLCSLEVLNVSVDDVGNYSCTTHYNKSFSFSMKRKMLYNDSNLRRVELKLAGDSSNSSESTSKTAQIIFGGVVGVFIIIGGVAGVILKGSSILDFLRKYCCKEFVQGDRENEPLLSGGTTTRSSLGNANHNTNDDNDGDEVEHDGPSRQPQQAPISNPVNYNGINAPPGPGNVNQSGNTGTLIYIQGNPGSNIQVTTSANERTILDGIAVELQDSVNVDCLIPYLKMHGLLNDDEEYNLISYLHSPHKKTQLLLGYLKRKGIGVLQKFLCCLNLEEQHTGHKDIADKLNEIMQANGIDCDCSVCK